MNDTLVRAMSKDGMVKATAVYTRALTERARQIHHTSPYRSARPCARRRLHAGQRPQGQR